MSDEGLFLRPGWLAATAALVLGIAAMAVIIGSDPAYSWATSRLALVGLIMLAMGTAIGSEHVVGLASAPVLGSALLGATSSGGPAWGRSLVVGCLWYVAVEAAWGSIEQRDGTTRTPAVRNQRLQEVATVVILALVVGLVGVAASSLAPERTLTVRGLMVAAALITLAGAVRHLTGTSPSERPAPARDTDHSETDTHAQPLGPDRH